MQREQHCFQHLVCIVGLGRGQCATIHAQRASMDPEQQLATMERHVAMKKDRNRIAVDSSPFKSNRRICRVVQTWPKERRQG
jgi:hypothetical protein